VLSAEAKSAIVHGQKRAAEGDARRISTSALRSSALKSLSAAIAISALSVLILSCNRTPDPNDVVNRLPELPPEVAANLTSTKIDNVLMTKDPPPVHGDVKPLDTPRACIKRYVAYVVYPMTICFPPDVLREGELVSAKAQADAPGWSPASQPATRYYKLSKIDRLPSICRVSGGPWYAEVTTTEDCDGSAISALTITGAPQPFSVSWDGGINAVPPPFNPSSFALAGQNCQGQCCGGFDQCLNGKCVPRGVSCDNHPAVKRDVPPN
jgi:hypothetical protein